MATQIIFNIILSFSIYLLLSTSFYIIYNVAKFFHFAHAAIITISAYFVYLFSQQLNLSLFFSISFAILLSVLLIIIIELHIYKLMRKRNSTPLLMLIASLGLYIVLQNCISLIWGDSVNTIGTDNVKVGNEFLYAYISNIQIITIIVSIVLFVAFLLFSKFHMIGRNMRAVSSNKTLADINGINSNNTILWSFIIGSGFAAISGILFAFDNGLTPTMGFKLFLFGVVAMIIGGVSNLWGIVGGSLLLAIAQNLGAYYLNSQWMNGITYIILILFLIWKPLGFSGKQLKKVEI